MSQNGNVDRNSGADKALALITELGKFRPQDVESDGDQRYRAIELSKKLTATLEGPVNRATELVFKVLVPYCEIGW